LKGRTLSWKRKGESQVGKEREIEGDSKDGKENGLDKFEIQKWKDLL